MKRILLSCGFAFWVVTGCSVGSERGIADKRSDFRRFIPLSEDPTSHGLRAVEPFFRDVDRGRILSIIEKACAVRGKRGSAVYDERRHAGYYVNCNPDNRQLLNGYVPANSKEAPHSRPE
ncbi:MAG TPA: hypothetical protein VK493_02305 [Bryobacteraceae bacterium]|nr:hypothetical protein [Bryobacteraceae bacterium]